MLYQPRLPSNGSPNSNQRVASIVHFPANRSNAITTTTTTKTRQLFINICEYIKCAYCRQCNLIKFCWHKLRRREGKLWWFVSPRAHIILLFPYMLHVGNNRKLHFTTHFFLLKFAAQAVVEKISLIFLYFRFYVFIDQSPKTRQTKNCLFHYNEVILWKARTQGFAKLLPVANNYCFLVCFL